MLSLAELSKHSRVVLLPPSLQFVQRDHQISQKNVFAFLISHMTLTSRVRLNEWFRRKSNAFTWSDHEVNCTHKSAILPLNTSNFGAHVNMSIGELHAFLKEKRVVIEHMTSCCNMAYEKKPIPQAVTSLRNPLLGEVDNRVISVQASFLKWSQKGSSR